VLIASATVFSLAMKLPSVQFFKAHFRCPFAETLSTEENIVSADKSLFPATK